MTEKERSETVWEEELAEIHECPACRGDGHLVGRPGGTRLLGSREWFRCRDCGWTWG